MHPTPSGVLEKMRTHLRDNLSDKYPDISFRITKRAIEVSFNSPLADETDPTDTDLSTS